MPWISNIIVKHFPNLATEIADHFVRDNNSVEVQKLKNDIADLQQRIEDIQNDHILDIADIHEKHIKEKAELISKHDMLLIQEASAIRTLIENEKNKEFSDMEDALKILSEENDNFRVLLEKFNIVL